MATKSQSEEANELYAALGKALNRWGSIEHSLCSLFCWCINEGNSWPSVRAFWAVISFEGKLEMVSEVVRGRFQHRPKVVETWETVRERLKKKAGLRNKLAHGSVIRMTNYKRGKCDPDLFLSPYHWKIHYAKPITRKDTQNPRYDGRPKDRLYTKNINEIAKQFQDANEAVLQFRRDALAIIQLEALAEREGEQPH